MSTPWSKRFRPSFLAALLLVFAPALPAQMGGTANPPPSTGNITNGKDKSPTNYENTMNMASPRETDAFKVFVNIPDSNFDKKSKTGEEFIHKYPNSVYLPQVYSTLSVLYIENRQADKGFADGENAVALKPDDVGTMANLAQAMARLNNPSDPDAAQKLQKAEDYAKKCIQLTPTLPKPANLSDEQVTASKNKALAMAHSALGLVNVRRGKYAEAIPDLQEAVHLDEGKDVTNLYLLGVASQNSSHYSEAVDAFTKCAAVSGNLQQPCRDGLAEAQKHVGTK